MSELRRSCRWFLRYAGAHYCRREAFVNPQAPMKKLDLGCDCNVDVDFQPLAWKADACQDPDERGDTRKIVEWEDEP